MCHLVLDSRWFTRLSGSSLRAVFYFRTPPPPLSSSLLGNCSCTVLSSSTPSTIVAPPLTFGSYSGDDLPYACRLAPQAHFRPLGRPKSQTSTAPCSVVRLAARQTLCSFGTRDCLTHRHMPNEPLCFRHRRSYSPTPVVSLLLKSGDIVDSQRVKSSAIPSRARSTLACPLRPALNDVRNLILCQ